MCFCVDVDFVHESETAWWFVANIFKIIRRTDDLSSYVAANDYIPVFFSKSVDDLLLSSSVNQLMIRSLLLLLQFVVFFISSLMIFMCKLQRYTLCFFDLLFASSTISMFSYVASNMFSASLCFAACFSTRLLHLEVVFFTLFQSRADFFFLDSFSYDGVFFPLFYCLQLRCRTSIPSQIWLCLLLHCFLVIKHPNWISKHDTMTSSNSVTLYVFDTLPR